MNRAARHALANQSRTAAASVQPMSVWDAQCTVVEPTPPRAHYLVAVALATFAGRRWMAGLEVKHWLHAYPYLVASNWDDDDSSGLVGMRWGIELTSGRALPALLCLADALCGRFDWVLFIDDDTVADPAAIEALLTTPVSTLVAAATAPVASAGRRGSVAFGTFAGAIGQQASSSAAAAGGRIDPSQPHFLSFGPQVTRCTP